VTSLPPYSPAVPAGLDPGARLPTPRRPRVFAVLVWLLVITVMLACGLLALLAISEATGALGFLTGLVLAAIPVFPVVAAFLWLDRYEAEPPSLLAFAFAWGAGVAALGALVINTASVQAIRAAGGDPSRAALGVAPLVEETLKGLVILLIFLMRRREFDGVVDGIVYAGMVGVGFAFMENTLYLGRAMAEGGTGATVLVFVVRCIVSPFAHPLFTAATGIGIGLAARSNKKWLWVVGPLAGWFVAVLLHSAWNLSAMSGLAGFVVAYAVFQLPIFVAFVALALLARRREGRLIATHLHVYGTTGWLSPQEVAMLSSLSARRDARGWAGRTGGKAGSQAMRDFQEMGSELAFLRERMVRGTAPEDARTLESAMLARMSGLRAAFVPRWVTATA